MQDSLAADVTCPQRPGGSSEYAGPAQFIVEFRYRNGIVIRIEGALRTP